LVSDDISSIGDALRWGERELGESGIDDFKISAEVLLRHILGVNRSEFLTNVNRSIESGLFKIYKDYIRRRARHEPLQYITGVTEFYDVVIKCDKRALIPRPETEILVETVISRLKGSADISILDIGAGSGNIVCALAKNFPDAQVIGVDISPDAIALASDNAEINGLSSKVEFVLGDISDSGFVVSLGKFDCVISNPPYVSESDRQMLQPEVRDFEPAIALFSPDDPLRFYKVITRACGTLLKDGGLLAFEIGHGQQIEIAGIMRDNDFFQIEIINDLAGIPRVITGLLSLKSS